MPVHPMLTPSQMRAHHPTMTKILDPGHRYDLLVIDGKTPQQLTFVKRCNPAQAYPGNTNSYPGTTLQSVMPCLLERVTYLQGQFWCVENWLILRALAICLWLLEFRAARRHGRYYVHTPRFASTAPMCLVCGHTQCTHA